MKGAPGHRVLPELADLPHAPTVLLLVDFINPLQFDAAQLLAEPALQAASHAARLKRDACRRGVSTIYVNDNFGHWRSDFRDLVSHCRQLRGAAARIARLLAPRPEDLTVLKPRHSGFHATPLDMLLKRMGTQQLVIAGLSTDLCVQFTAMDAFLLGFALWVPADCSAAESPQRHEAALEWMARALKCHVDNAASTA